ncbi:MAG: cobalamin-dependent protein, partial [Saprospiraceae bacterium]|nr:cobalamin-dependent protein [Saprospiraceae bacterium]
MDILFAHGYFLCDDPKEQEIMRPYPPLGLLCLSAWLDKHGVENAVFDTTFSNNKALKTFLLLHRPRIVALYANMMTKQSILDIAAFIHAELADTLVVLGGSDVTHNAADYLANGADLLVIGEGEQTMLEICLSAQTIPKGADKRHFSHINGIAFRQADGLVFKTPPREKLRDMDVLPFPNRSKIDLQQYFDTWKKAHGESAVSINTQRGCPYTCRWCSTPVFGQSYRRHSPQHVVDEIVFLQ